MIDAKRDAKSPRTVGPFEGTGVGVFILTYLTGEKPTTELFDLVKSSWKGADRLVTLAQEVEKQRQKHAPKLSFIPYVPKALAHLEFGGKE